MTLPEESLPAPFREMYTRISMILIVGLAVLLMLFGLVFGTIGGLGVRKQHIMMKTYLPIQATVLSTAVESRTTRNMDDRDGGSTVTSYFPVVEYRYEVSGVSYVSKQVFPIAYGASSKWANKFINEYRVDHTVEAFYNPKDPLEAFLSKGPNLVMLVFLVLSPVLLVLGFLVLKFRVRLAK